MKKLIILLGVLLAFPAHAQISTAPDSEFIQLTPQQEESMKQEQQPDRVVQGGKDSYVPAPRTAGVPTEAAQEETKEDTDKPKEKSGKGMEICDIVAGVIARDFRVIIANPHSNSLDVHTVGSGPYDVAIKNILPYSNIYTAMGCDGKELQVAVAGALRKAAKEGKK